MANLTGNSNTISWTPNALPNKEHVRLTIEVEDAPMSVEKLRAVFDAITMDEAKSKVDVDENAIFTIEAYVEVPSELPRPSLMADGGTVRYNHTAANDYSFRSNP